MQQYGIQLAGLLTQLGLKEIVREREMLRDNYPFIVT
jgi:hypothetical protein